MEKLSKKLCEAVTNLGNDLTAARWPEGKHGGRTYNTSLTFKELVLTAGDVAFLEAEYRDCVNELCLKCGQYKREHEGACDGCRWLKPRRGW